MHVSNKDLKEFTYIDWYPSRYGVARPSLNQPSDEAVAIRV